MTHPPINERRCVDAEEPFNLRTNPSKLKRLSHGDLALSISAQITGGGSVLDVVRADSLVCVSLGCENTHLAARFAISTRREVEEAEYECAIVVESADRDREAGDVDNTCAVSYPV